MLTGASARKLIARLFPRLGPGNPKEARSRRRTSRAAVGRPRPSLERLEDRLTPSATATYSGVNEVFTLTVTTSTDAVAVSTPNTGVDNVQIDLTGEAITAGSGVSGNPNFDLGNPHSLKIDTVGAPMLTFAINGGAITVSSGANLNPSILNAGSSATITLVGTGNATNVNGVTVNGATLNAGAGNITLNGNGATSGTTAFGVVLTNGQVSATGTGTVSITASSTGAGNAPALVADSATTISAASTADNITLTSDNGANVAGTVTTPGGLLLDGTVTGDFGLTSPANSVARLAANLAGALTFLDKVSLAVTTVFTTNGFTASSALLQSSAANTALTVSQPVTTNGSGDVTFIFDNMTLSAGVTATGHDVTLEPFTAGQAITLGTTMAGTLSLLQSDLNNVTASDLTIGSSTAGSSTITAAVTASAGWNTLSLLCGGALVSATASGVTDVTVAGLMVFAGNGIGSGANPLKINASNVAARNNVGDINLMSVSATGLTLNGSAVAGLSNIRNNAAGGQVTLTVLDQAGIGQDLTLSGSAIVAANGGKVALRAGDNLTIGVTATVQTAGSGTIELDVDFGDADGVGGTATLRGASLQGAASALLEGSGASDTFNLDSLTGVPLTIDGGGNAAGPTQTASVTVNGMTLSRSGAVGDVVNIDDSGSAASTGYVLNSAALNQTNQMALTLANVETVVLTTTTGQDSVTVNGSPALFTTVNNKGANSVVVTSTAANSALTLNGASAGLSYHVNGTGAGSVVVGQGGTAKSSFFVYGSGAQSGVSLSGGANHDIFSVVASGTGSLLALSSTSGGTFTVGGLGTIDGIAGQVSVSGGSGATVVLNDQAQTANGLSYTVTGSVATRKGLAGFALFYAGASELEVIAGAGNDMMLLTGQAVGTHIDLLGGGGNDSFTVNVTTSTGYNGVSINGGAGTNFLFVIDQSGGASSQVTPTSAVSGMVTTTYPTKPGSKKSVLSYKNVPTANISFT